jgi:PncC family amidohydrolase
MVSLQIVQDFNNKLKAKNLTIFCGESITAGLLASTIASVPGASAVLKGSVVTYDANVKIQILGVSAELIKQHTAESQETTTAMCYGLKKVYPDASIHVAVTGVASTPVNDYVVNKKEGQVYVSILYNEFMSEFENLIDPGNSGDKRNSIRNKTVEFIFEKIEQVISSTHV